MLLRFDKLLNLQKELFILATLLRVLRSVTLRRVLRCTVTLLFRAGHRPFAVRQLGPLPAIVTVKSGSYSRMTFS